jgi:intracellular sulfur oxidation DsrE/DsrF family protein
MQILKNALLFASIVISAQLAAAEPALGPVIETYGPVYSVPQGSFNLDPKQSYKIIMDIGKAPEDPSAVNRSIESAARFLNMHARNGIDPGRLEFAIVLHGSAGRAALTDQAHAEHFNVPNGNKALLDELDQAGVAIYICGQTVAHRGFSPDQLLPQVTIAVSAMTVHVRLQQEGYRAILF